MHRGGGVNILETLKEINSSVNYWKEIEENLSDELKNLRGIVLLVHNSMEFTDIIDFLQRVRQGQFLNVLYISLVRSYDYMKKALELKPLDQKRMMFIDCVSGYAFPIEENLDEAFFHKPPQNLDEMKDIIRFGIEKTNADMIIIDSLSQFISFTQPTEDEIVELYEFLKTLKEGMMNVMQNTVLLLYDDKLRVMQNLPKTSVDLILRIEIGEKN
jgi:hypothetical protein